MAPRETERKFSGEHHAGEPNADMFRNNTLSAASYVRSKNPRAPVMTELAEVGKLVSGPAHQYYKMNLHKWALQSAGLDRRAPPAHAGSPSAPAARVPAEDEVLAGEFSSHAPSEQGSDDTQPLPRSQWEALANIYGVSVITARVVEEIIAKFPLTPDISVMRLQNYVVRTDVPLRTSVTEFEALNLEAGGGEHGFYTGSTLTMEFFQRLSAKHRSAVLLAINSTGTSLHSLSLDAMVKCIITSQANTTLAYRMSAAHSELVHGQTHSFPEPRPLTPAHTKSWAQECEEELNDYGDSGLEGEIIKVKASAPVGARPTHKQPCSRCKHISHSEPRCRFAHKSAWKTAPPAFRDMFPWEKIVTGEIDPIQGARQWDTKVDELRAAKYAQQHKPHSPRAAASASVTDSRFDQLAQQVTRIEQALAALTLVHNTQNAHSYSASVFESVSAALYTEGPPAHAPLTSAAGGTARRVNPAPKRVSFAPLPDQGWRARTRAGTTNERTPTGTVPDTGEPAVAVEKGTLPPRDSAPRGKEGTSAPAYMPPHRRTNPPEGEQTPNQHAPAPTDGQHMLKHLAETLRGLSKLAAAAATGAEGATSQPLATETPRASTEDATASTEDATGESAAAVRAPIIGKAIHLDTTAHSVELCGVRAAKVMLDTGSDLSLFGPAMLEAITAHGTPLVNGPRLITSTGQVSQHCLKRTADCVPLELQPRTSHSSAVLLHLAYCPHAQYDLLLGMDYLSAISAKLDCRQMTCTYATESGEWAIVHGLPAERVSHSAVMSGGTVQLPVLSMSATAWPPQGTSQQNAPVPDTDFCATFDSPYVLKAPVRPESRGDALRSSVVDALKRIIAWAHEHSDTPVWFLLAGATDCDITIPEWPNSAHAHPAQGPPNVTFGTALVNSFVRKCGAYWTNLAPAGVVAPSVAAMKRGDALRAQAVLAAGRALMVCDANSAWGGGASDYVFEQTLHVIPPIIMFAGVCSDAFVGDDPGAVRTATGVTDKPSAANEEGLKAQGVMPIPDFIPYPPDPPWLS